MPNRGFAFLFIVTIQYSQHEAFHFGGLVLEIWNFSGAWGRCLVFCSADRAEIVFDSVRL